MKTYRLTTLALLALLPIACSKDGDGRLRIYAEEMYGSHNTKVWVNPSDVSASASWVVGEQIDLNGTSYPIANDGDGNYLDAEENALSESLYAIYPATVNTDGNNITVTNNGASASTVVINSLSVNFRDGGHDIIFPMATGQTDKSSGKLLFKHLTGGMKLTLVNTTASDCTVRSVKVVVYGDGAAPTPITAHNVTTRWAAQGPVLPGGEIGANDGNQTVGYASEMHFALKDNGADRQDHHLWQQHQLRGTRYHHPNQTPRSYRLWHQWRPALRQGQNTPVGPDNSSQLYVQHPRNNILNPRNMETKKQYTAPELTVVTFKSERGYAGSGGLQTSVLTLFCMEAEPSYNTQYQENWTNGGDVFNAW